ncbi:MAG: phosphatidate cytidylyltransferase [Bacilli bacterium]|nr:phosphatidate cytidylyltransferase [Bacilli bacterium]
MKKRIIGIALMLLICVPLLILGGVYYSVLIGIVSVLGLWELNNLYKQDKKLHIILEIFSYLCLLMIIFSYDYLIYAIGLTILVFLTASMVTGKEFTFKNACFVLACIIFMGVSFYIIKDIRLESIHHFVYVLLIPILTDTFAFIGGSLFGKHKLIERVSPNKTIEGAIIGAIFGTIIPVFYYLYMVDPGCDVLIISLITFALSIVGEVGDLVFSSIKREFGIKDYSNLIIGHGGILDRFDSLIFVSIMFWIIKAIIL